MGPILLPDRAVLSLTGLERLSFLQGLVTQDVEKLEVGGLSWGGFLTPQGKITCLFFLFKSDDAVFIDCPLSESEAIFTHLKRFKLRSKVEIAKTPYHILVADEAIAPLGDILIAHQDPRMPKMGWRALSLSSKNPHGGEEYLQKRLSLAVPEQEDIIAGETLVLEINMDHLHGVSWDKGCYLGQEVTARSHYRGLIKKRLFMVSHPQGHFLADERRIMNKDGKEVGHLRSFSKMRGLIILHRNAWNEEKLFYQGQEILLHKPEYLQNIPL